MIGAHRPQPPAMAPKSTLMVESGFLLLLLKRGADRPSGNTMSVEPCTLQGSPRQFAPHLDR